MDEENETSQTKPSDQVQGPTPLRLIETLPVGTPLDELDWNTVRKGYSTLFDRAAQAVFRTGLDLDDIIVNRFIVCENQAEGTKRLPLESLADQTLSLRQIRDAFQQSDQLVDSAFCGITIVALQVEAAEDHPATPSSPPNS